MIDTHCHLTMLTQNKTKISSEEGLIQISNIVNESGLDAIVTVSTSLDDSINSVYLAQKLPKVFATVGIHPCDCGEGWKSQFEEIKIMLKKKDSDIVAFGETGLDFYHKPFFKQRQIDAFISHIECALEHELPVVVHIRESAEEVLKILERYKGSLRGVAHCFSQSKDIAKILIDWGFYLGIGGPISYPKNDKLREICKEVDLKNLLLETDAPFLPPQQYRGKKNHPKYIQLIAEALAEVKQVDVKEVADVTTANARDLFGLPATRSL